MDNNQNNESSDTQYQQVAQAAQPAPMVPIAPETVTPVVPVPAQTGEKSYLVAFLLSVFLGMLGIDRFYLGYIGTGLIKLFTFGGFGVWALIDLITIFLNKKKSKNGMELSGYAARKKLATIIFIIVMLLYLSSIAFSVIRFTSSVATLAKGVTVTVTPASDDLKNSTQIIKQTVDSNATTDFGSVVSANGYSVKIASVTQDPETTGDQPDAGMKYILVDLSVTNNSSSDDFLSGDFAYQAVSNQQYLKANVFGTDTASKSVQVKDRSYNDEYLDSGETINPFGVIFQVPKNTVAGDGLLIWRDGDFGDRGIKLATFKLK